MPLVAAIWVQFEPIEEVAAEMVHTTERFLQIETIFHAALAAPEQTRAGVIGAACKGDVELEAEIHSLIEAGDEEERLTARLRLHPERAPDGQESYPQVGPYKVDRLLGRGGMGAVYLAHRADGQYEQNVAIKLIDLPLATEVFRGRFRQERQILAELQHPYIARLLDGGVTARGDLYLVMEYVDGMPIHRYCEHRRLPIPERLQLFLLVCEAVQFAHHHFIVHRDLKPDNVLVAEDGTPRLLDFGTAKLLSPSIDPSDRMLTREGYLSFTPQYASPEQVLGGPITTATDSYSLGVMLYLLLTGTLPYELKELTTGEMLHTICEAPPRRPEHAVNSSARLDADLEAILSKALRKEPRERYLTAEQFASDLHAYLKGLPVMACRGTLRYRAGKFIRRNRLRLAGLALLLIILFGGIAGIAWQAQLAKQQRRRAEARSADLRQLSNSLLSELDEAIKELPGSTGAQKLLVTRVLEHLDRMASDARGDRLTSLDLVDAYTRLGNIQGNAYDQNLGDSAGALVSLDKALAIAEPLAAPSRDDWESVRALALVQQSRSEILWQTGKTPQAIPVMREAIKSFDSLVVNPQASATTICEVSSAYGTLGDELGQNGTASMGDSAGAIGAYRKSMELDARALRIDPHLVRARRGIAINSLKIGGIEVETNPAEALKEFQAALQSLDLLPAADRTSLSGRFEQSRAILHRVAADDPKDLRALFDEVTVLDDEARSYEDAADPLFTTDAAVRRANLVVAGQRLAEAIGDVERLLRHDPANDIWKADLGQMQVRAGIVARALHGAGIADQSTRKGLAALREVAEKPQASPLVLDQAANAFVTAEPVSLRNPPLAVLFAERENEMSLEKTPYRLLTLSRAYRASGQVDKSRTAAQEGLTMLPPPSQSAKPLIRKRLEVLVRPGT